MKYSSCALAILLAALVLLAKPASVSSQLPSWLYHAPSDVLAVSISDDGKYVAIGCYDGNVFYFDKAFTNSKDLGRYATTNRVRTVAASSNGEYFAAGSNDKNVYLFRREGQDIRKLWNFQTQGVINSISISGNGEHLVAGSYDGRVYFFDRAFTDKKPL